jgi:hypothetical protein
MRVRITKLGLSLAALVALAVGGSSLASASHKSTPPVQAPAAVQVQGDQSAPDTAAAGTADTDNVQQGDQSGVEQADSASEQSASESGPGDGPGGYADANPSADTQQQGEN